MASRSNKIELLQKMLLLCSSKMSEDDPITGIGVVESLANVPQGYNAISSSADGKDADIWKDGFFGRAVRRYICFTRVFPLDNGRWRNVVKDIRIVKVSINLHFTE